ncbi:MAG: N-methylhydantoinase [Gaiellaceae bacterium]|nr:N-methylhydantoinase [Gaiellaceae bacterium]
MPEPVRRGELRNAGDVREYASRVIVDGWVSPALGARGGLAGARAQQHRRDRRGRMRELESFGNVSLLAGETIISISCGGRGYGDSWSEERRLSRRERSRETTATARGGQRRHRDGFREGAGCRVSR